MKAQVPLKVGFDLDGVILYNPARVVRPLIAAYKRHILRQTPRTKFRIPKHQWERTVLAFLHKSSLFLAPGIEDIRQLVKEGKIEAYLITARFSFLKPDFDKWLHKMKAQEIFKAIHLNENDEQPHLYKAKLVNQYDLDVFVDDNWDIVNHLHKNAAGKRTIYWIYNLLDKKMSYPHKHPTLKSMLQALRQHHDL
jgi:hypothetical protein